MMYRSTYKQPDGSLTFTGFVFVPDAERTDNPYFDHLNHAIVEAVDKIIENDITPRMVLKEKKRKD